MEPPGAVTQLLIQWSNGNQSAVDQLVPLVYAELRRLATGHIRREQPGHSLQATALVHEAFLRMIDNRRVNLTSRAQFFGLASKLMRNILVDLARQRQSKKRGGDALLLSLSKADGIAGRNSLDLVAVDEALNELAVDHPRHSQIVEMRFFGGLTIEETAEVLGSSHATVQREWNFARAWLRRKLGRK
jgi:RNA polymerase sigma factor (TIGR02999 family)